MESQSLEEINAGMIQEDDLQSQHCGSMAEEETEIRAGWQTLLPR